MSCNPLSTAGAFNKLPIELNKMIAHHLPADMDVANFRGICKNANHAIDGDNFSFWRFRFRQKFAIVVGTTNAQLMEKYKRRTKYLRRGASIPFIRGHTTLEAKMLKVVRDLIIESFRGQVLIDKYGNPQCPNQVELAKFVMNSRILLNGKRAPPPKDDEPRTVHPLLAAVRLMCAHFLFDLYAARQAVLEIEESQRIVYAATNSAPIYIGQHRNEINMEWTMHCMNLFRYYMTMPDASSLYDSVWDLGPSKWPSPWRDPLQSGTYPLSKCWRGTYAYLQHADLTRLRNLSASPGRGLRDVVFTDLNVDEGKIQTLTLDFVDEEKLEWPSVFEDRLQSLRQTLLPRRDVQHSRKSKASAQEDTSSKNIRFKGEGEDLKDTFFATGWLNPLPPQCGIPGWQRITFMKHFEKDLDYIDEDNLWAYEGVVLPGGRIILGRWWYASEPVNFDRDYSGPFILWAVEDELTPETDDESDNQSAVGVF